MKQKKQLLNKYLQPLGSTIDKSNKQDKRIPWQWGVNQKIQTKKVRASSGQFVNMSALNTVLKELNATLGTLSQMTLSQAMMTDTTMTNNSGGTIIDPTGLLSITNFENDGASSVSGTSTTSNTSGTVTGSSLSPLILTRNARVLTNLIATGYNNGFPGNQNDLMQVSLIDSIEGTLTSIGIAGQWITTSVDLSTGFINGAGGNDQDVSFPSLTTFSAGTHTMHMEFYAANGGTATLDAWGLYYLVLGT